MNALIALIITTITRVGEVGVSGVQILPKLGNLRISYLYLSVRRNFCLINLSRCQSFCFKYMIGSVFYYLSFCSPLKVSPSVGETIYLDVFPP